jgi:hypothetical protein
MWLPVLGLGLATPCAWAQLEEVDQVARLIRQLGSEQYSEREAASRQLDSVGPDCLEALRQATRDDDAEVRRRAAELVARIEQRLENQKLLTPRRIRLAYRDRPVAEALADFSQRSGYALQLHGNTAGLADRKITLETDDIPFWEALGRFCAAAGLQERDSGKPLPGPGQRQAGAKQIVILREQPVPASADPRIFLTDGPPPPLPTALAGSVRIQAVPLPRGNTVGEGEALVTLEATAEPSLQWLGILDVRIDRARDDQGQELSQPLAGMAANPAAGAETVWANGAAVIWDVDGNSVNATPRQATVRLTGRKKPSQRLERLSGVLTGRVLTGPQPLAAIDNLLQSAGQSVDVPESGTLKVLDVTRQANGQVKLRIERQTPAPGVILGNGVVRVNGRVIVMQQGGQVGRPAASELSLEDGQGQAYQLVAQADKNTNFNPNGLVQELELTFQPRPGQAAPARLVIHGRKTVVLEVPFQLENVPLP